MAHGLSVTLREIPRRTQEWVHLHVVPDHKGYDGKMHPTPANRAERRTARDWLSGEVPAPYTDPYEKENHHDG